MQVDNPPHQLPYFQEFSDIFNTDLFADDPASNSPPTASSSRGSSPQSPYHSSLLTPPQQPPPHAFPEFTPSSFFFDDDINAKQLDPMAISAMNTAPYDFFGAGFEGDTGIGIDATMAMELGMNLPGIATGIVGETMGIDPQLVGTPSSLSDIVEEHEDHDGADVDHDADADVSASPSSSGDSPPATTTSSKSSKARGKRKEKELEQELEEQEKLTLVIQPVKVGGHGKARKGTVQSGGIVKKAPSSNVALSLGKENAFSGSILTAPSPPPTFMPPSAFQPTNIYTHPMSNGQKKDKDEEDDDDLPQDWRPSPEVLAKMSSKEKRQLRNKISARNFRVRRKEYISTLEGDIAERDRLLEAIQSELGSTQSENLALRQEIAALKRTLLDGRVPSTNADGTEYPMLNLPPPAPLPAQSAAATLAQAQAQAQQQQQAQSSPLLTPNTQKDTSKNGRFWGGVRLGMGMGGVTPVHRVILPEVSVADMLQSQFSPSPFVVMPKDDKWKENVNPLLNAFDGAGAMDRKIEKENKAVEKETEKERLAMGFEGFADMNPFTLKTLDAYRMHLWGKMASQHHHHYQNQHHQQQLLQQQQQHAQQHLTGLASNLRPAFFSAPTPLASMLAGKHQHQHLTPPPSSPAPPYSQSHKETTPGSPPPPYTSPPSSPLLLGKGGVVEKLERERRERERESMRKEEKDAAVYAAIASQTLLRKLGSAFWDAFSGSPSSSGGSPIVPGSSSSSSSAASGTGIGSGTGARAWDADKVRKVLEGKAVVRVVDIEETQTKERQQHQPQTSTQNQTQTQRDKCCYAVLEESMRSLTLNKKP